MDQLTKAILDSDTVAVADRLLELGKDAVFRQSFGAFLVLAERQKDPALVSQLRQSLASVSSTTGDTAHDEVYQDGATNITDYEMSPRNTEPEAINNNNDDKDSEECESGASRSDKESLRDLDDPQYRDSAASLHSKDREGILPVLEHQCDISLRFLTKKEQCETLKLLLQVGFPYNIADPSQQALMHHAAIARSCDAVQLLIDQGAEVDPCDLQHVTPLMLAAKHGNLETMKFLIDKGADIKHIDLCDQTALHYACKSNCVACVEFLLSSGIEFHCNMMRETELMVAISHNAEDVVEDLIQSGADVNMATRQLATALHYAAQYNCPKAASVLCQCEQVNIGCTDRLGYTAHAVAAKNGHVEVLKVLVKESELRILNHLTKNMKSCLELAAMNGQTSCVSVLLEAGVDLHAHTTLAAAAQSGCLETLTLLFSALKRNQELDQIELTGHDMMHPLHIAVVNNYLECVKFLLNEGANPNAILTSGETALMMAASKNVHAVGTELITAMKSNNDIRGINSVCAQKRTALHNAASVGAVDFVQLLLENGADPDICDKRGNTPLFVAVRKNSPEVVRLLLQANCDVNIHNINQWNALHLCAASNNTQCAEMLMQCGLSPDRYAWISSIVPIHLAAKRGHSEMIHLLMKYGAMVDRADWDGQTAVFLAAKSARVQCIETLILYNATLTTSFNKFGLSPLKVAALGMNILPMICLLKYNCNLSKHDTIEILTSATERLSRSRCETCEICDLIHLLHYTSGFFNFKDLSNFTDAAMTLKDTVRSPDITRAVDSILCWGWSPQTLSEICRHCIRLCMGSGLWFINGLPMLPLPQALQDFIALKKECSVNNPFQPDMEEDAVEDNEPTIQHLDNVDTDFQNI